MELMCLFAKRVGSWDLIGTTDWLTRSCPGVIESPSTQVNARSDQGLFFCVILIAYPLFNKKTPKQNNKLQSCFLSNHDPEELLKCEGCVWLSLKPLSQNVYGMTWVRANQPCAESMPAPVLPLHPTICALRIACFLTLICKLLLHAGPKQWSMFV